MRTRVTSFAICLALITALSPLAAAQTPIDNWSSVTDLQTNTYVFVRLHKGKKIRGLLQSADDASIDVLRKNKTHKIDKSEIKTINLGEYRNAEKAKNIGAGLGMLAGLVLAAVLVGDTDVQTAMSGVPVVLAGGGAGYLIGKRRGNKLKKGQLIYQNK